MFMENRTWLKDNQVLVIGLFRGTKKIGKEGENEERGIIVPFPNFSDVEFGELQPKENLPNQLNCMWAATDKEYAPRYERTRK